MNCVNSNNALEIDASVGSGLPTLAKTFEWYEAARSRSREVWRPVSTLINAAATSDLMGAGRYAGPNNTLQEFMQTTAKWIEAREALVYAESVLTAAILRTIVAEGHCTSEVAASAIIDAEYLHREIVPTVWISFAGREGLSVKLPSGEIRPVRL